MLSRNCLSNDFYHWKTSFKSAEWIKEIGIKEKSKKNASTQELDEGRKKKLQTIGRKGVPIPMEPYKSIELLQGSKGKNTKGSGRPTWGCLGELESMEPFVPPHYSPPASQLSARVLETVAGAFHYACPKWLWLELRFCQSSRILTRGPLPLDIATSFQNSNRLINF